MNIENKTVVFLLKSFVLGGAERQALYLANYLKTKKNCRVIIYSTVTQSTEFFYQEAEKYGLAELIEADNPLSAAGKYKITKYIKRRLKLYKFSKELKKQKPDIIIPYLNTPSIIANLCSQRAGAKVTFWHHRGVDHFRNDKLQTSAVKKTKFFIANSESGRVEMTKVLGAPAEKTHFLPNFSTIEKINKKRNNSILNSLAKDTVVIGMVAHFRAHKHHLQLVECFKQVFDSNPKAHLVLAGNTYDYPADKIAFEKVKTFIEQNNLSKHVTILHEIQAHEVLPYFDIGVLLSINEGMANVIMEYMAYQLPVVANDHAGSVALLGDDYPYYVDNFDSQTVVNSLASLVQDVSKRKEIGEINKKRLTDKYSIENYLSSLSNIIYND